MINTSAESNDIAHAVHNRHDNSVCKSVVRSLSVGNKSALLQIFEQISFATHISDHTFVVERQSQTVAFCDFVVKSTIVQIFSCVLALLFVEEVVAIIPCRVAHKLFQDVAVLFLLSVLRIEFDFGKLQPYLVGKDFTAS